MNPFKTWKRGAAVIGGTIALAVGGFAACSVQITPGYAGVVYNKMGGLEEETLGQGLKPVLPWKSVTAYPVSTETVYLKKTKDEDHSLNVSTSEGKPVNLDVMYSYNMEASKLPHIFTKFKRQTSEQIEATYIKSQLQDAIQLVTSKYGILEVYGEKRGEIQTQVQDNLAKRLKVDGINLEKFTLGEIRPDEGAMKAINTKVDAQQAQETMKVALETAKVEADKKRAEAQGEADKKVIAAQGEAKANKELQQSLSPDIINYEIAKKWDGKQPLVSGGSSIINMPSELLKGEVKK